MLNPFVLKGLANVGTGAINTSQEIIKNNLIKQLLMDSMATMQPKPIAPIAGISSPEALSQGIGSPKAPSVGREVPKTSNQMLKDLMTDRAFGSLMTRDPNIAMQLMNYVTGMGGKEEEPYTLSEGQKRFKGGEVIAEVPKSTKETKSIIYDTPEQQQEAIAKLNAMNPNKKYHWIPDVSGQGLTAKYVAIDEPSDLSKRRFDVKRLEKIQEPLRDKYFNKKTGEQIQIPVARREEMERDANLINQIYAQLKEPFRARVEFVDQASLPFGIRDDFYRMVIESTGDLGTPTPTSDTGLQETPATDTSPVMVTEEDIKLTMQKYNMSREEVLRRLNIKE